MRRSSSVWVVLLVLALAVSGCTEAPTDRSGSNGDTAGDGPDDPGDDQLPRTGDPDPEDPRGPPPQEQRVDNAEDVDEPGEYALLPRASDAQDVRWEVPAWTEGDEWLWEHRFTASPQTRTQTRDTVTGTGEAWDVPVYQVLRTYSDVEGTTSNANQANVTAASLVDLEEDGYIEHIFVFPLEDGKRWIYARDAHDGITKVRGEARHEPAYAWNGEVIEAWAIVLTFEDDDLEMRYWLGVDQKNFVHREIWSEYDGTPTMFWSTTLVSYTPG